MARLTRTQRFDRQEWIAKLRAQIERSTRKMIEVELRPNGLTMEEVVNELGPEYAGQVKKDRTVRLAKMLIA